MKSKLTVCIKNEGADFPKLMCLEGRYRIVMFTSFTRGMCLHDDLYPTDVGLILNEDKMVNFKKFTGEIILKN